MRGKETIQNTRNYANHNQIKLGENHFKMNKLI